MTVRTEGIAKVIPEGIVMKEGTEVKLDVLICATGFNTSFRPLFNLIGEDGANPGDEWKKEPKAYLGIAAAKFPNYFSAYTIM